jgi:outer membrane protein, heavy metal efflux system
MRNLLHTLIMTAVAIAVYSPSFANPPPLLDNCQHRISISKFRAYALNNSPLVADINVNYASKLAEAIRTELLANPELQLERTFTKMHLGGDNDPQDQVSLSQNLRLSDFGSRRHVASIVRESSKTEQATALFRFVTELSFKFKLLVNLLKSRDVFNDSLNAFANKLSYVKTGVKKGLIPESGEAILIAERSKLLGESKSIASTIAQLQRELVAATGLNCSFKPLSTQEQHLPKLKSILKKFKNSNFSTLNQLKIDFKLKQAHAKLNRLDAYPAISPRLVFQHTNDGGDFYGVGVSIPLPIFNQNQANIYNSEKELAASKEKLATAQGGSLREQIVLFYRSIEALQAERVILQTVTIPSFDRALKAIIRLFENGKGDIVQIWQTLKAIHEAKLKVIELDSETANLTAQLSILVGEEL